MRSAGNTDKPTPPEPDFRERLRRLPAQRAVIIAEPGRNPPALAYVTRFPRLVTVLDGKHRETLSGADRSKSVRLSPGDSVWIPANSWNIPASDTQGLVLTFMFGHKRIGLSLVRYGEPGGPLIRKLPLLDNTDTVLLAIVQAMISLGERRDAGPTLTALAQALFARTATLPESGTTPGTSRGKARLTYEAACMHIQQRITENLSRDDVANALSISPAHLSRLFQTEGGHTFGQYLALVRLDRAKLLMREGTLSLKQIALDCGFCDQPHFCRVFKKTFRMSPLDYLAKSPATTRRAGA